MAGMTVSKQVSKLSQLFGVQESASSIVSLLDAN